MEEEARKGGKDAGGGIACCCGCEAVEKHVEATTDPCSVFGKHVSLGREVCYIEINSAGRSHDHLKNQIFFDGIKTCIHLIMVYNSSRVNVSHERNPLRESFAQAFGFP